MSAPERQDTDTTTDIEAIQNDIELTRRQLGETVDALTARLDVKARTRARFQTTRDRAVDGIGTARARARSLAADAQDRATDERGTVRREVLVTAAVVALLAVAATTVAVRRGRR
jgi:uncharacterized protein DUF3618